MNKISERACAKLNLSLDVTGLRPDGYHEMRMLMQSVDLCDEVKINLTNDGEIRVRTNLRYLPSDGRNIAWKAARAFFDALGEEGPGAEITLKKRIPVCAGLGGGSSDGAA
ncbi:MAG: 4-(cytidine 5'-diphospho)-2-C-methyl-D-erythritol kinase, partial [Butyricicoccus sp.]|nr:4-(cytidine 5'-diphospho)-2-C-methyl-D-erythritol kinase [Butyricicoccus sp.]